MFNLRTTVMADDSLAEKEFLLIQEISRKDTRTQRDLSNSLGLSLGMTNLLIQRLARKGLIKVTQLDWKRTQYLLTIKGAMEKTRKACRYTLYTLRVFKQIQDNIATVMNREYKSGRRDFTLVAEDEILVLLQETVQDMSLEGATFRFVSKFDQVPASVDLVLTATMERPESKGSRRYVSLVDFDNIDFRVA